MSGIVKTLETKGQSEDSHILWGEAQSFVPGRLANLLFASQPERLIGLGRLVFSGFAFLAVYLDPTHPTRDVAETYFILAIYVGYSAFLSIFLAYRTLEAQGQFAIHAVDIVTLCVLVHYTDGLTSPFFAFVTFALLTATMRWSWRGALATALILEALLLLASWPDIDLSLDEQSELNLLIMRGAYLFVAAAMLGYLGAYRERSRSRLSMLAEWPLATSTKEAQTENPPLAHSLRHASDVVGASLLLVFWQDREQSTGRMALWTGKACDFVNMPDMERWQFVAAGPTQATLHTVDTVRAGSTNRPPEFIPPFLFTWDGDNAARFHTVCTAPFRGSRFIGRVFVLDPRDRSEDILSLTQIVASRIVSELERFALAKELAAAAIADERIRLARDMHDSVLQDLTAANLLLKSITNGMAAGSALPFRGVSQLLVSQQKRIRAFVESARSNVISIQTPLADQLAAFVDVLERQWGCTLAVNIDPPDLEADTRFSAEICQLLSEATANAVRHGGAGRIDVSIAQQIGALRLTICDNGRGLQGNTQSYSKLQPHSIKARVLALGGKFSVGASSRGLLLEIEIPS